MYIEKFGIGKTLILLPGAYHTGRCYSEKLDNTSSWVDYLAQFFTVYVTDLPGHGRSEAIPFQEVTGKRIVAEYQSFIEKLDGPVILLTHSMSGPYGYCLTEQLPEGKISHHIAIEPGPIGNIPVPLTNVHHAQDSVSFEMNSIGFTLPLDKLIEPTEEFIQRVTKKYSKRFPQQFITKYIETLIPLHPRLLYERFNINNSQLAIRDFSRLRHCKNILLSGEMDPLHVELDKDLVFELKSKNVLVDFFQLGKLGIHGNGHMMMLEDNSEEIIAKICNWLTK